MKTLLVTGAAGFIGRHIVEAASRRGDVRVVSVTRTADLSALLARERIVDSVIHLAGVNRPQSETEYDAGNRGETFRLCEALDAVGFRGPIVFSSSSHAAGETAYGVSKRGAEEVLAAWARRSGGHAVIFRLKNVFGKWCRPNYNSAVATFCHNLSHDLPVSVNDPEREIELVYIDDVVVALLGAALERGAGRGEVSFADVSPVYRKRLGEITELIGGFRLMREALALPRFDDEFVRRLYATYLSYLDAERLDYALPQRTDHRGALAEFIKGASFGQIFVSRTKPGVTRGNHYHHTKTEKFLVLEGEAIIRFRALGRDEVREYRVLGKEMRVVDIPPGYTHSIENVGSGELVTLFWSSEVFDPAVPDTMPENVIPARP